MIFRMLAPVSAALVTNPALRRQEDGGTVPAVFRPPTEDYGERTGRAPISSRAFSAGTFGAAATSFHAFAGLYAQCTALRRTDWTAES